MKNFCTLLGYVCVSWALVTVVYKIFRTISVFGLCGVSRRRVDLRQKYGSWAVVTGSTDGVGKAYAKELARRGINIVLISRTLEKLQKVSAEIEDEFKVKTKIVVADFSSGPVVYEKIEQDLQDIPVGILVNNVANMFEPTYFNETPIPHLWDTIYVNVGAAVIMSRMIMPQMKRRGKGAIVNVSSLCEETPWPFFATYAASKAFMKSFTFALQNENRNNDITIQLLSPSVLKTNLTKFSYIMHKVNDFLFPNAEVFAREAVKTLGVVDHTSGFWPHEIQYWLCGIQSISIRPFTAGMVSRMLKAECCRRKSYTSREH